MFKHAIKKKEQIENSPAYKGEFSDIVKYYKNDIVKYGGLYYHPKETSLHTPPFISQVWELNEPFFYITTEIEEPIGFDGFKVKIGRNDYHGISVEVSNSLEFYGDAYSIVKSAYETDIDAELIYIVQQNYSGSDEFIEMYRGVIDLTTYTNQESDYCSCTCKVGDIGAKTTFNNRMEVAVDINRLTSIDGDTLTELSNLKRKLEIPGKEIILTSKGYVTEDTTYTLTNSDQDINSQSIIFIGLGFINEIASELPASNIGDPPICASGYYARNASWTYDDMPRIWKKSDIQSNMKCVSSSYKIKFRWIGDIRFSSDYTSTLHSSLYFTIFLTKKRPGASGGFEEGDVLWKTDSFKIKIKDPESDIPVWPFDLWQIIIDTLPQEVDIEDIDSIDELFFYAVYSYTKDLVNNFETINNYEITCKTFKNSYFEITSPSLCENSTSDVAFVHETFSRISEIISGLTVKSDLYARTDSQVNPIISGNYAVGNGALKTLILGYWLRNVKMTDGSDYAINISFKDLLQAMQAIDNIGFGFSEENGVLYVRVENWKWFYNDEIIITINNPNKKERSLSTDRIYSSLEVGYSKYADTETVNAIDTFHTERVFTSSLKSVSNVLSQKSKYVADPYAIEVTRRKSLDKTTADWKYDENIMVLAIKAVQSGENINYSVDQGMQDTGNSVISPETMTNVRISPLRNALRFADIIFIPNSVISEFPYTSGTGNVQATGKPKTENNVFYLNDSAQGADKRENESIHRTELFLKPEFISLTYPLTAEEYTAIKNNPYGKIIVDDEQCYLSDFEYDLNKNLATFKLIPKNE